MRQLPAAVRAAGLGFVADGPPRGTGRHAPLRRHRRPRRRLVRRRGGAHLGPHRPERRREDDGVQRHHAALQARLGRGRRSTARRSCAQPAYRIVGKGIARTFQNLQLFRTMSVLENVLVGAHGRGRKVGEAEALEVLDVVGLRDRALLPRGRAAVRDPEAGRARARARREAATAPARRAGRRPEPRGGRRARRRSSRGSATTSSSRCSSSSTT